MILLISARYRDYFRLDMLYLLAHSGGNARPQGFRRAAPARRADGLAPARAAPCHAGIEAGGKALDMPVNAGAGTLPERSAVEHGKNVCSGTLAARKKQARFSRGDGPPLRRQAFFDAGRSYDARSV